MTPGRWIRCGSLVDGHGKPPLTDMAVEVNGPLIGQVVPWAQAPDSARAHAVDLSGHTLAPGFVDAHVHLLFTARETHEATRAASRRPSAARRRRRRWRWPA
ncbi:hypothetical protein AB0K48_61275, partial [Nonomuraea sp. NPDC055795]